MTQFYISAKMKESHIQSHKMEHIRPEMKHLFKRGKRYYYNRRVPGFLHEYDNRKNIRISLKTDSYDQALKKCASLDKQIEAYWQTLILTGKKHSEDSYRRAVSLAHQWGFAYKTTEELRHERLEGLVKRMAFVEEDNQDKSNIILGTIAPPYIKLSNCLEKFWHLINDRLMNKSPNQIRKWKNPRIKAINNLIKVIGDKPLDELTRDHTLVFKDWWVERIKQDGLTANTANKDIGNIKDVLATISEHYRLEFDSSWLFGKTALKENFKKERKPFQTSFIKEKLLNPTELSGLNAQARYFLYSMADTGARGSELVELERKDIILDGSIPHIIIHDRKTKLLKTPYSNRTIPLVGYALQAFQKCPEGFTNYRDRFDSLSNLLHKYLKTHNLLPSKNHTVYSLRHSFQDRLTHVNAPDRVQAQLMGHKFNRPEYGQGASLTLKKEWMDRVCLLNFEKEQLKPVS